MKANNPLVHITTTRNQTTQELEMLLYPEGYQDSHFLKSYVEGCAKDFWDRRRLHPEYIKLCEGVRFDKSGLVNPVWVQNNMAVYSEKADQIKVKFGLDQMVDPRKDSDELNPSIIHHFGVAPITVRAIAKQKPTHRISNRNFPDPKPFLEDNKYLTLKVDVTEKVSRILPLLKFYIEFFQSHVDPEKMKGSERYQFSKHNDYYRVWIERKKRKGFLAIAKELGISEDVAKKRYYRAYELIMEKPYGRDVAKRFEVHKSELDRTCENCPDRQACKDPCPEILAYIDQDQVSETEGLQANYHLLYSEDREED